MKSLVTSLPDIKSAFWRKATSLAERRKPEAGLRTLLLLACFGTAFGWSTAIAAPPQNPDTGYILLLENGDRIRGEHLETRPDGVIVFLSPVLGRLEVPGDRARLTSPAAPRPDGESVGEEIVIVLKSEIEDVAEKPKPAPRPAPPRPRPPQPATDKSKYRTLNIPGLKWASYPADWRGNFRYRLSFLEGRRSEFSTRAENNLRFSRNKREYGINLLYDYSKANLRKTRDNYGARFTYNYRFNPDSFFQAETSFDVDRVKRVDYDIRQSFGYGLRWEKKDTYQFNLVPGGSVKFTDTSSIGRNEDFVVLARLFQGFNYQINDSYSIDQRFEGFIAPDDPDTWDFKAHVALLGSITAQLALEMRYEFDYDNTLAQNIRKDNARVTSSLVYRY